MDKIDISLNTSAGCFNYRVGAVILDNDNVLMAKNSSGNHFYSVGGRVGFGETLQDAVIREAFEETKVHLEIDRLVYIHENFFIWKPKQTPFHEVAFFYLMKPSEEIHQKQFGCLSEEYGDVSLSWLPIHALERLHLYPEFFKTNIKNLGHGLPQEVRHFVTKDGITTRVN
jgi:ADP-ribose pyrophosphatase YjhB (NUDIX family)